MDQHNKNLSIFDGPHYNMNKKLLTIFGLWPTLSRGRKVISLVLVVLVTLTLYGPILAGVFYYQKLSNWIYIVENIVALLYLTVTLCKYLASYIFEDRIKLIYEQIDADWNNLIDEDEIKILNKHSRFARLLSIAYVYYALFAETIFYGFPFITLIMDKISPLENETRHRVKPYHPYYYIIDSEKYYYHLYLFHGTVVSMVVTISVISIDIMFAANIQHTCGLFSIVRYRLDKIGRLDNEQEYESRVANDQEIYKSIVDVCDMHRNSLRSVELIWNSFSITFLIFMGSCVLAIAILFFDFIFNLSHPVEKMMAVVISFGINILLFYMNWIAQQLTNSSEDIFIAVYSNKWYNLSIKGQKLVYFLLQNNVKKITLRAGGVVEMNLQQFAAILKTSMSYATVMMSMND